MTRKSPYDAEYLERIRQAQYNVVTRAQAFSSGLERNAIHYRLRPGGPWQRLLPGIYLTVTGSVSLDHRAVAARLYGGPRSLISGPTALRRLRLTCPGPDAVDLLVPWTSQLQSLEFVRVHRTRHLPDTCYRTGLIVFAVPARAVADAARWSTKLDDVRQVVSEALLRNACTLPELVAELHLGGMPRSRLLRIALAEAATGTRSAAEVKFRRLLLSSDLPAPVFNAQLFDERGDFIAMPDAWWPEAGVAAEIDSRQFHINARDKEATERRHSKMIAHGILVHHFSPNRVDTDGQAILGELRSAIAHGMRRTPPSIMTTPLAA